jgi:hypothetical protein
MHALNLEGSGRPASRRSFWSAVKNDGRFLFHFPFYLSPTLHTWDGLCDDWRREISVSEESIPVDFDVTPMPWVVDHSPWLKRNANPFPKWPCVAALSVALLKLQCVWPCSLWLEPLWMIFLYNRGNLVFHCFWWNILVSLAETVFRLQPRSL